MGCHPLVGINLFDSNGLTGLVPTVVGVQRPSLSNNCQVYRWISTHYMYNDTHVNIIRIMILYYKLRGYIGWGSVFS